MTVDREQVRRERTEEWADAIIDALGYMEPGRGDREYEAAKKALGGLLAELEQAEREIARQQNLWTEQSLVIREVQARAEQAERERDEETTQLHSLRWLLGIDTHPGEEEQSATASHANLDALLRDPTRRLRGV